MRLSRNFTMREMLQSRRYPHLVPDPDQLPWQVVVMLARLTHEPLQPARDLAASPLYVESGYRDRALNTAVDGDPYSRHMVVLPGGLYAAADIVSATLPMESLFRMFAVESAIQFDRCCLYTEKGHIHVDIRDWTLGPGRRLMYKDRGQGWEPVSRTEVARLA